MRNQYRLLTFLLTLSLAVGACADDGAEPSVDAGIDAPADLYEDMGFDLQDMTAPDASDASKDDAGADLGEDMSDLTDMLDMIEITPFGTISGECGDLDGPEIDAATPFFFENAITFDTEFMSPADLVRLTEGGQEIVADGNAGGSSLYSEVFAYEVLSRCELAGLLKTETEIVYETQGKITDLLVTVEAQKVGVSVTRAVTFPREDAYTVQRAQDLLEGKLGDILLSSANVAAEDVWEKQILHVLADRADHATSLRTAWSQIDDAVKADTIVYVTITEGTDDFIY